MSAALKLAELRKEWAALILLLDHPHDERLAQLLSDWEALEAVFQALTTADYPWQKDSIRLGASRLTHALDTVRRLRGER
jgi:hypothetical protein